MLTGLKLLKQMVYDNYGRKISMTDLDMGTWSYIYDAPGNLVSQVDAKGQRLCFSHDTIRHTYFLAGQAIATRVSGDPTSGNNGLFYIYSDHPSTALGTSLGSASLLVNSSNNPVAGSRTWYLPFGGYHPGSAPTQTITDLEWQWVMDSSLLWLVYSDPNLGGYTLVAQLGSPVITRSTGHITEDLPYQLLL